METAPPPVTLTAHRRMAKRRITARRRSPGRRVLPSGDLPSGDGEGLHRVHGYGDTGADADRDGVGWRVVRVSPVVEQAPRRHLYGAGEPVRQKPAIRARARRVTVTILHRRADCDDHLARRRQLHERRHADVCSVASARVRGFVGERRCVCGLRGDREAQYRRS